MAGRLKPCGNANCRRHVRTHERACPFCGEPLALSEPIEELRLLSRLDRNTMVALGAVLSAAGIALGCREAAPVAIYGAPAPPDQFQAAPSAAPPPAAPVAPATPDSTAPAPAPSPPMPEASSAATPAPAPTPAPTHATKPPASAQPLAPAAAYGAPPNMRPDGITPPPLKSDPKK